MLDSGELNIPLNMNILKQKLKDSDLKNSIKNSEEEAIANPRMDNHFFSFGRNAAKRKPKYVGEAEKTKVETCQQTSKKSEEEQQSNWLYKKFAEAALTKKENPNKKTSPILNKSCQDEVLVKESNRIVNRGSGSPEAGREQKRRENNKDLLQYSKVNNTK